MSDIRSLEHPTLKVPYETLNKRFRIVQKILERESSHVGAAADAANKAILEEEGVDEAVDALLAKVENATNKAEEATAAEIQAAVSIKHRLDHLKGGLAVPLANLPPTSAVAAQTSAAYALWQRKRVDRMLVEHFLRSGYYDCAVRLAKAAGVEELVNIDIFLVAKEVEEALAKGDTAKCLSWCHDNRSKMRKIKSTLEANIRLQEFVELVKAGQKREAVKHAQKYLAALAAPGGHIGGEGATVLRRAMALLVFQGDTRIPAYRELLSEDRWRTLVEQFRAENYRLHQLSAQSVFSVVLQAGLSALKTQRCSPAAASQHGQQRPPAAHQQEAAIGAGKAASSGDRNGECPVCQNALFQLAAPLPYAHCSQSRLICYISGRPLNEHNPPLMLPNGFVYGRDALTAMAAENDGQVICPRTRDIFSLAEADKVFVM